MKILERFWPWKQLLEQKREISTLQTALLRIEVKYEMECEHHEKDLKQIEAHRGHIRKMGEILSHVGRISITLFLMMFSVFAQPTLRNNVTTNNLGLAPADGWHLVSSNNLPVWSRNLGLGTNVVSDPTKVSTNDSRNLVLTSATNNLGTDISAVNLWASSVVYTTNPVTTGNGTVTMDMSKTYALLTTNANITVSLANVPTATDRPSVLIISNSLGSGNTFILTASGFSFLTNGVPTQTAYLTNLTAKNQVALLSVNAYANILTNAVLTHFYNP